MGTGSSRWNFSRRCAMTLGSRSSPAMAIAGSPGRSCCSPKISTDTRKTVGTIVARRLARNASMARASVHLEVLQADDSVGDRAQSRELVRVRPQQVPVVQIHDGAILRHL